jgi:hypothetical protein
MKPKELLAKVRHLIEVEGLTQAQAVERLTAEGVTTPMGKKWDQSGLSKFCVSRGFRINRPRYVTMSRPRQARATVRRSKSAQRSLNEQDILDIMTSNLGKDLKLRTITLLVKGGVSA